MNANRISAENEIKRYLEWMSRCHEHLELGDPTNVCEQMRKMLNLYPETKMEILDADVLRCGWFMDLHGLSAYDLINMCHVMDISQDFEYFGYDEESKVIITYTEHEFCEFFRFMAEELAEYIVKMYGFDNSMFHDIPAIMWILHKFLGD